MRHLDTCIVIAYLNGNQAVAEKLKSHLPDVAISSLVLGELLYGARASARSTENLRNLNAFAQLVDIIDFNQASADSYSRIRLSLRRKGRPSGETDMLIAAIAVADNAIFVTDNTKHFQHIENLRLENWLRE
ncbi:PIN domain-containing protein [Desulfonema magnum]|uniref:Ribonuclease VapC n=1 Tax=Desulfonema magnum TaxID=45655 RepID=A0A975BGY6_9BACT|nr:PIN domain-containing protein [Desulfonema magnum]QTA85100.1 PIN domain-containing protein [Desulfonema magnum]